MPYQMERIYAAIREADLFVSIGTSGAVYPAAGFVRDAREMESLRSLGADHATVWLRERGEAVFDEMDALARMMPIQSFRDMILAIGSDDASVGYSSYMAVQMFFKGTNVVGIAG